MFKHRSKPPRPSVRPITLATSIAKPSVPKLYLDPSDGPAQAVDDITQEDETPDNVWLARGRTPKKMPPPIKASMRANSLLVRVVRPSLFNQLRVMLSTMLARLAWRIAP